MLETMCAESADHVTRIGEPCINCMQQMRQAHYHTLPYGMNHQLAWSIGAWRPPLGGDPLCSKGAC